MKNSPVRKYKTPDYPSREEFLSKSGSLQEYIPDNWKNKKVLTTALAVFLFGGNDYGSNVNSRDNITTAIEQNQNGDALKNHPAKSISDEKTPAIAPIFIHGDGRGSSGCVVINPPVFLSEVDARQIIESELLKEGIVFEMKNYRIDELYFEQKFGWFGQDDENEDEENYMSFREDDKDTVVFDAYSPELNLAYEFVSANDYYKFGGEFDGSSVSSYDVVKAAENLREKMKEYGKLNTVIFYDPMADNETSESKNESYESLKRYSDRFGEDKNNEEPYDYFTAKNLKSNELLKRQVADFIEWIKKEGLLNKK